jgi:hypothetical protein
MGLRCGQNFEKSVLRKALLINAFVYLTFALNHQWTPFYRIV